MIHIVDLQIASAIEPLPSLTELQQWVKEALSDVDKQMELTIRIVEETESAALNERYRKKAGPTNVLSFPYEGPQESKVILLGDIIICAPIVVKEARTQQRDLLFHWAHMVIHGTLHLLGYDHQTNEDAIEMETLETRHLLALGFPPPYGVI